MNAPVVPNSLRRPVPAGFLDALKAYFGARFSNAQAVREHHGRDESPYPPMLPDGVVFAESTEEVAWLAKQCHEHRVPLIPFGVGSSLEGHLLAVQGGISVDLSGMNKLVAVHAEDFTATVQAGVTRKQLNEEIRDTGLFFPIDPGADASLGGMAATRASGTNAVRYGTMRENVMSLKVVTADGRVIETANRARKSSAGYDLTRIFVGSEGTLGIITEVTVRLFPQPEAISAAICNFPSLQAAVQSVIEVIQMGVPVARVEFMDTWAVKATNAYSKLDLQESPLLLFEFHGSPAGVKEQAQVVQEITRDNGGMDFQWAEQPEDRSRLWTARHNAYFAGLQLRPGCRSSTTDVCVPISRLAECVGQTAAELDQASFPYTIVGHVGDGNFHVLMLLDPDSPQEWEESEQLNQRLVQRALDMEGTCTGEHGVGLHKMEFMLAEHGQDALDLMSSLKAAFDPHNILNPGKIIPQH
ncbi:FAD-binding oxidoreductase [Pollutimonas thiosulfatoxidans]|uniref:D-lactate dehydrogenase (cytochrome) n=1 Tax=Pollutimonas thiosulfatoxidans TaxID=2028345 RepID=A0A410GBM4_9BURK|nr:FAD-linked oxidase C-terminal domain-containing protein [Pollutimonas thiosulfatoxidans]MBF6617848.1 FAD-binding protein [Candidimonas sp.]NYT46107.1 FAD-binding protein [Alcaligenaceae bacterium]QAA93697.1 2-hydroxy-acid oxidase [Pollutimonas thiosulfatoxidans]